MEKIKSILLSKRFKTFYWYTGLTALIFLLNNISAGLGFLELPTWLVIILSNALAQVTKYLNTQVAPTLEEQLER